MANNAGAKLLQVSIENNLIKLENDITMTFARDKIVGKNSFGEVLSFYDGYGK